jgi:hypothetical protein
MKIKMVCRKNKGSSDEEGESSSKKVLLLLSNKNNWSNRRDYEQRKFEEQDGVFVDGLKESLGTKIGNDARLVDTTNTKKDIYFKMQDIDLLMLYIRIFIFFLSFCLFL